MPDTALKAEQSKRGAARRSQLDRDELVDLILHAMPDDGRVEVVEGLVLRRHAACGEPIHGVAQPTLCVIAQGAKEILLGEETYRYDPFHYLLSTAELPVVGQIVEATAERPFLGLVLTLESALVSSVMAEVGHVVSEARTNIRALDVRPLGGSLLGAVVRLVRLLETPDEYAILAPLIKREIVFRLLKEEQGHRLHHIVMLGGTSHRIARAIRKLRGSYDQPLRIDSMAGELGMSPSSFYQHFKDVTGMTPLQFQKQLQLQEARRLMLVDEVDAASAGFRVGYNNPSHFSREYKRLFGKPPLRDVERLRGSAVANETQAGTTNA